MTHEQPSPPPYGAQPPEGHRPQQPPFGQAPYEQQPPGRPGAQEPPYGQTPYGQAPYGQQAGSDDRAIAVLAHLSPLIAMLLSAGWLSILGPLVVWLLFRDRGLLVRNAAATAFNFHITVWLATVLGWVCLFTIVLIPAAILLWVGAFVLQVVFSVIGAVRANRGEVYRYPMQVPVLR